MDIKDCPICCDQPMAFKTMKTTICVWPTYSKKTSYIWFCVHCKKEKTTKKHPYLSKMLS